MVAGRTIARSRGIPVLGALGNSWVAQSLSGNDLTAKGIVNQVAARLKGRVRQTAASIAGYSGNTSTQILAATPAFVASGANIALVEALINDPTTGVDLATSKGNIASIVQQLIDGGILPIVQTVPPRGDANNTTAVRQQNLSVNDYLFDLMASKRRGDMYVADVASALTNRASSTGAQISGAYNTDNVHPIDYGAAKAADPYYAILDMLLPPITPLSVWQTNAFDRTAYRTGWLSGNYYMSGSSGTITSGGSGSLATGWTLTQTVGSTLRATCSKIAGINGGEYQQIDLGATGTGLATEQIEFARNVTGGEAGDIVQALHDLTCTNLSNVKGMYVYLNGSSTGLWRGMNNSGVSGDLMTASIDHMPRTLPVTLAATETLTLKLVIVAKCDGTAPTGTIVWKSGGVKMLQAHA